MYLANTMGKPIITTKNISQKADEVVFECSGYLIPNKETLDKMGMDVSSPLIDMWKMPTVTHGTANAQNLNKNMMPHATVMAETRAIVRCLRILTRVMKRCERLISTAITLEILSVSSNPCQQPNFSHKRAIK